MPSLPGFATVILLTFATTVAQAHEPSPWAEDGELVELKGVLTDAWLGAPHAALAIEAGNTQWMIDLAALESPGGLERYSGAIGETITVVGYRASDPEWMALKAVQVLVTVGNGSTSV